MQLKAPAIVLAARPHGENAVILRALTEEAGLVAAIDEFEQEHEHEHDHQH